jgi:hypothetical protein
VTEKIRQSSRNNLLEKFKIDQIITRIRISNFSLPGNGRAKSKEQLSYQVQPIIRKVQLKPNYFDIQIGDSNMITTVQWYLNWH